MSIFVDLQHSNMFEFNEDQFYLNKFKIRTFKKVKTEGHAWSILIAATANVNVH